MGVAILAIIVNHENNAGAASLMEGFAPHAETFSIDSGSKLEGPYAGLFDLELPNVYYSGLFNVAAAEAVKRGCEHYFFVCSDVEVPDPGLLVGWIDSAFADPRVGCYAPSVDRSPHVQMRCKKTGGLREAAFVEGMCFAARTSLVEQMAPVDIEINLYGYALDVYLGYLALKTGLKSVVDDRMTVKHPSESGYDAKLAYKDQDRWLASLGPAVERFNKLTRKNFFQTRLGFRLLRPFYASS